MSLLVDPGNLNNQALKMAGAMFGFTFFVRLAAMRGLSNGNEEKQ